MSDYLLLTPDDVTIFACGKKQFNIEEIGVCKHTHLKIDVAAQGVAITLDSTIPLRFIRLRWNKVFEQSTLFCGDAWERSYGDLQWQTANPARVMPWYFFTYTDQITEAFGVKVRPNTMAYWTCDAKGITLWLDLRSGSRPVQLKGRCLEVATIVSAEYNNCSAFTAARQFCQLMCNDPLLPDTSVYGSNNWYYAYGNISHESVLKDAEYLARLTTNLTSRPFMVIDDGWQFFRRPDYIGGPWHQGNHKFPDMKKLAAEVKALDVRPGIWCRPLFFDLKKCRNLIPDQWRMAHNANVIDPSIPEVLEQVKSDVGRIREWGFDLIKHDYTTVDILGQYGFSMKYFPAAENVVFHDNTRTTAEIILSLYQAIREAARDMLILGCNTIGHLGAGLMHLARIGDDTSGIKWERTRKMGINTLAFRMCQNGTFFRADADCVGVSGKIPWQYNRQYSELIAKSQTAYFCSIRPGILQDFEEREVRRHLQIAAQHQDTLEPLDYLTTTVPAHWRDNSGEFYCDWFEPEGDLPDFI